MPEGPEVQYWVDVLNRQIGIQPVLSQWCIDNVVIGKTVFIDRRGKEMLIYQGDQQLVLVIRFGLTGSVIWDLPPQPPTSNTVATPVRFFALLFETVRFGVVIPIGSHGMIMFPNRDAYIPPSWGPDWTQFDPETFWLFLQNAKTYERPENATSSLATWLRSPQRITGLGKRVTTTALQRYRKTTWPANLAEATELFLAIQSVWNEMLTRYHSSPTPLQYPEMKHYVPS